MISLQLFNVSGPYGVGKDSILSAVLAALGPRGYRVSTLTTRPVSGDFDPTYRSVSNGEFADLTASGRWLVNTQLGNTLKYATSVDEIIRESATGRVPVCATYAGPFGAGALRGALGSSLLSIGLLATGGSDTEELDELELRLRSRGREDEATMVARREFQMEKIRYVRNNPLIETEKGPLRAFDAIVTNRELTVAIADVFRQLEARGVALGSVTNEK